MIAGRYEPGADRWRSGAGALVEGYDLLVGRRVLLETVAGPAAAPASLDHLGLPAPLRAGRWDGAAVVVHPFAPAPTPPATDEATASLIDALTAALARLAAAGAVHGGILPESLAVDDGRLTAVGATLASAGIAMPCSSPQVRQGARPAPADDAWSVAAVLGALLTGTSLAAADPALLVAAAEARPALLPAVTALVAMANPPGALPLRARALPRRRVVAAAAAALVGAGTAAAVATGAIGSGGGSPTAQPAAPVVSEGPSRPSALPPGVSLPGTVSVQPPIGARPPGVAAPATGAPPAATPGAGTTTQAPHAPGAVDLTVPLTVPGLPVPLPAVPLPAVPLPAVPLPTVPLPIALPIAVPTVPLAPTVPVAPTVPAPAEPAVPTVPVTVVPAPVVGPSLATAPEPDDRPHDAVAVEHELERRDDDRADATDRDGKVDSADTTDRDGDTNRGSEADRDGDANRESKTDRNGDTDRDGRADRHGGRRPDRDS